MSTAPKERLLGYHRIHVGHGRGKSPAILCEDGLIDGVDCYHAHSLEHAPRRLRRRFARKIARHIARSRRDGMFKAAVGAADWKKDPSYRWITVHPHDDEGAAGVPVLIKVHPDGKAHVVGGAGGSLTGMQLTKLRKPEDIQVEARERRRKLKERRDKERADDPEGVRDREAVTESVLGKVHLARAEMLAEVAATIGWNESVKLPESTTEQLSDGQRDRIERARARALEAEVKRYVTAIQDEVITQHNTAIASAIGDVPISAVIPQEASRGGRGYVDSIAALAAENGLTSGEVRTISDRVIDNRIDAGVRGGYIEDPAAAHAYIAMLQAGAEKARVEDKPLKERGAHRPQVQDAKEVVQGDPQQAAAIMLAYEKYRAVTREAAKVTRELGAE